MPGEQPETWDQQEGWPFWAPSDLAAVDAALDLASLGPGERFLDLGCGDGRVLVAAARRGAEVLGVEIDDSLVRKARRALRSAGHHGEVVACDLFDVDLRADVIFTYLAPATLQRLLPSLRRLRGTRLVTVDFEVPGLVADEVADRAHLYRLPGRRSRPRRPGWPAAGSLVVAPSLTESLTCLGLHHPGGPVRMRVPTGLRGAGTFRTGTDLADPGRPVAIDVRWDPVEAGTVVAGKLSVSGTEAHQVVVCFGDDEDHHGLWELSTGGVECLTRALRRRRDRPTTGPELLEAAEG